jgi:hypothetical protein
MDERYVTVLMSSQARKGISPPPCGLFITSQLMHPLKLWTSFVDLRDECQFQARC